MAAHRRHGMRNREWSLLPLSSPLSSHAVQQVLQHPKRGRLFIEALLLSAGRLAREQQRHDVRHAI